MKTKEKLNAIKEEVKTLNKKLAELTEEELKQVTGGGERRVFSEDPETNVRITVAEPVLDPRHIQSGNELSYPEEYFNMIIHQQGYQSNSRLLTTSDAILEKNRRSRGDKL